MDVSIVIVNFNTCRILDECIVSIKKETTVDNEIIVVDNASVDGSCQMLCEKHPDVKLIENQENVGFAKANNQGFAIASGKYFFMLNSDTVVLDGAVGKLAAFMDEHPDVGICGPRNEGTDGELQYSCDHFPSFWNNLWSYTNFTNRFPEIALFRRGLMRYWDYSGQRDVEKIMGCSLMIRKDLYRQLGGLDNSYFMYFEETDLCFQARKAGLRTVYFPDARIIHYGGASAKSQKSEQVVNTTVASYYYKSKYYFLLKNYGTFPMLANRFLDLVFGIALMLRNSLRKDKEKRSFSLSKARALLAGALCSASRRAS
jgi:GT2 family glycosyltransferase